jgi:hypothetical protein
MDWEHKCDIEWLRERQLHLTATDVRRLIPFTATGRARRITDEDYMKVLANKLTEVTEDDCWSYGAAARGHLLEPYAVAEFDAYLQSTGADEFFYHWDDALVSNAFGPLAFSPDAMNVEMYKDPFSATAIAELKSYSAERHLITSHLPKDRIEERWQIATAMAVSHNIDHAFLVLYNPSLSSGALYAIRFDRKELENEIYEVLEVEKEYREFVACFDFVSTPSKAIKIDPLYTEEFIQREITEEQRERSVINPELGGR